MKLTVNNQETELAVGGTLLQLAEQLQLPPQGVAIAVNNRMIPRPQWDGHVLQEGDRLVIIKAACGG
ncbi:sulfur carrier protein ThiS [uncultured Bacteroides sp.]|uniref:sulfur carrier protein ThiS n=1 Tax=uncultured Bacteroides sp. TaxID=162156 RepID=UPI002634A652|nr:sulfur carrier protein ThiS [uncultured Bacteroides sp.]